MTIFAYPNYLSIYMITITIKLTEQEMKNLRDKGEIEISVDSRKKEKDNAGGGGEPQQCSFFELIQHRINQLKQAGCERTSETYKSALSRFRRFRKDDDLPLSAITPDVMEQYQAYLRGCNLTMNTVSFHMRILRAVYYKGVKQGLTTDCQPFRDVYTGNPRTQKRALTIEMLKRIKRLTPATPQQAFARDMFMLSFYLRGMSFVDMAYLKRSDIQNSLLTYKRRKTGQMLAVKWEPPMQEIADRYSGSQSGQSVYLLPIIRQQNGKERNQYRNYQTSINKNLKEVARLAGIDMNLTMYCARHTWATVAREMQVPMNIISRAMGHTNERTTETYIRTIDASIVDRANEQILQMI